MRKKNLGHGGDRKSKGQDGMLKETAKEIAEENNISDRTVKRNANYAKAIDEIKKTLLK